VSDRPDPQGVIAILTGPDGHVYAVGTDFNTSYSSGYTIKEAQECRAKRMMADLFVVNSCSGFVAKAMRDGDVDAIVATICQRDGFRRTVKYIGYPEDEQ
jgi:hypothetical protein